MLELVVTMTIAGILFGIAIPSFNEAIRNNRLTTQANDFVTALNVARSEAVKRGISVTVRRVDNNSSTNLGAGANWEDGWDVFTDVNANGIFNVGTDQLIKTFGALQNLYTLRGDANLTAFIRYGADGRSNLALPTRQGIFVLCDDRDNNATPEANTSRVIEVSMLGRVNMGSDTNTPTDGIPNVDTNNDGIPEANLVTCQP